MKKVLICFLALFLLCSCSAANTNDVKKENNEKSEAAAYVKAVWMSYYELQYFTTGCDTAEAFKKEIDTAFTFLKDKGFNTVTVQVRPCADAFYNSSYFPVSRYCFGEEGCDLKYDPLELMCTSAHAADLRIEAWVNPYRVSQENKTDALSDKNIAKQWYKEKSTNVYVTKKQIFFNPASEEVRQLIVNGVQEIVKNYDVDAIHFDDYFYPTTDKAIDKAEYAAYQANGGELSLGNWRREQVSAMIKSVYNAIKKEKSQVQFGISPASNMKNNYDKLYADVYKWSTEKGYCDYICPQIYFGFLNDVQPFMKTVKDWRDLVTACNLYVGLPLYKSGQKDTYAGRGEQEFVENSNLISRQIKFINQIEEVQGYYIFSYGYLFDSKIENELANLYSAMQ